MGKRRPYGVGDGTVRKSVSEFGGAENAELDIARLDNAAPYRKGGQRET